MEKIIMYTLPTWPDCVEAKRFFSQNKVDYEERDCTKDVYRSELMNKYKRRLVPTFIYKGEVITGFAQNKSLIKKLLNIS